MALLLWRFSLASIGGVVTFTCNQLMTIRFRASLRTSQHGIQRRQLLCLNGIRMTAVVKVFTCKHWFQNVRALLHEHYGWEEESLKWELISRKLIACLALKLLINYAFDSHIVKGGSALRLLNNCISGSYIFKASSLKHCWGFLLQTFLL